MATDPTISLHAADGMQQNGAFGQLGGTLETINKLNQVKLFQQSFAAKQKAGAILATAPDLQTGLDNLAKDPDVNAFAPELVDAARARLNAQAQYEGTQQDQREKGLQGVTRGIVAAGANATQRKAVIDAYMSTLSPGQQKIMQGPVSALESSLTEGLPADPEQARKEVLKRAAALGTSVGMTVPQLEPAYGQGGTLDTGPSIIPTVRNAATNELGVTGAPIAKGVPPQVTEPGKPTIGGAGGGVGPNPMTGGSMGAPVAPPANARALGVAPDPRAAAITRANGGGGGASGNLPAPDDSGIVAATAPGGETVPVAGDGKPLWSSPDDIKSPLKFQLGTGGKPIMNDTENAQSLHSLDDYNGAGKDRFTAAQNSMANFATLSSDLDNLAHTGGFLTPGALGTLREKIASGLNTTMQIVSKKGNVPFDAGAIASAESAMKETGRLGPQVLGQLTGQNHQAAQTMESLTATVPGINNTYMGGKLVLDGLQALARRTIDERNFQARWLANPENHGNLTGADVAFNRLHPAEQYAQGVLDKYGLSSKGFKTPEDVGNAVHMGYLTPTQAKSILQSQFGMK
jgi:hypothetical protein